MCWTDAEEDLQAIAEAAGAVAPAFFPDEDIVAPALPPGEAVPAAGEAEMPGDPPDEEFLAFLWHQPQEAPELNGDAAMEELVGAMAALGHPQHNDQPPG